MKHFNLILTALSLSAVVLFLILLGSVSVYVDSAKQLEQEAARKEAAEQVAEQEAKEADVYAPADLEPELLFDLKYEKYLTPEPYTYQVEGESREFQFEKILKAIALADKEMKKGRLTYIDNYKDRNGRAPAWQGKNIDGEGNHRTGSAPAYVDPQSPEDFRYIEDGTLVRIVKEEDDYTTVIPVDSKDGKNYLVPSWYVPTNDCLTELTKAIVVDRKNQNIVALEKYYKENDKPYVWKIVSYSMATTGKEGPYHEPTPLGYFYAIEKKPHFYYLKDGTTQIQGYAPYAIRFAGGAYTHGVGVDYKFTPDGQKIDPGMQEFSNSIGTVPLSHKCVRNYTSHAKFLYDWYEHGKTIVIVIE